MREGLLIQPVTAADLLVITRMAYANMAGVDEEFSKLLSHRLSRWAGYAVLPLYLFLAGQGYKAVLGGRIIGCAFLDIRQRTGCAFNVSVNADYRRHGVATELMAHLEHVTRTKNRHWMALQVNPSNRPGWKLYRRLGYRAYHPSFLRHERPGMLMLPAPATQVTVEPVGRHGPHAFRQLAALERSAGDSWADQVVADEYGPATPVGGAYWRCCYGGAEMGCAWTGGSGSSATLFLLLRPAYWGHAATMSLLALLRQRLPQPPDLLDFHVGSSEHYAAVAPLLQPFGFQETVQKRVLMLKLIA